MNGIWALKPYLGGSLTLRPKIVVCPRPWPQTMLGRSNPLALPMFSISTWSYLLATSLHPFYKMDAPKLALTVFFLRGICNLMPKCSKPQQTLKAESIMFTPSRAIQPFQVGMRRESLVPQPPLRAPKPKKTLDPETPKP